MFEACFLLARACLGITNNLRGPLHTREHKLGFVGMLINPSKTLRFFKSNLVVVIDFYAQKMTL